MSAKKNVYDPAGNIGKYGTAVALGFFDGVHRGHALLFGKLKEIAAANGLKTVVYTFVNQPAAVLGKNVKLLCSNRQKASYIAASGIDELCFDWFDEEFGNKSPEEFASEILAKRLNAKTVVAGNNYTFGKNAAGNSATLSELGKKYGFDTVILPPRKCTLDCVRVPVSSSLLRKLAAEGRMAEFRRLSGHPYAFEGTVTRGKEIGRTIGFPTANVIPPDNMLLPAFGVYATVSYLTASPERRYRSITNVGVNPTIRGRKKTVTVESYLDGFSGDIYGKEITVEFAEKMREEIRFDTVEELRAQLDLDIASRRAMRR